MVHATAWGPTLMHEIFSALQLIFSSLQFYGLGNAAPSSIYDQVALMSPHFEVLTDTTYCNYVDYGKQIKN